MANRDSRLTTLSYDDWIEHVFGHEVRSQRNPWYFDPDHEWWSPTPVEFVGHLTRLFEDPDPLVGMFADSQIAQGLTYLVDTSASGDDGHLANTAVPIADRLRLVRSIEILFERLFASRCTPHLSHLDEPGVGILNGRCYMWWDSFPSLALPGDAHLPTLQEAALATVKRILMLDSVACQESALHGLGHWHSLQPDRVESIIDDFLAAHPTARVELLAYARSARCGCVL